MEEWEKQEGPTLDDLDELSFYEDDNTFILAMTSDEAWAYLEGQVLE